MCVRERLSEREREREREDVVESKHLHKKQKS